MRVTNSNANAASPLIVAGYNVSGSVRSDGEPMKGVKFLLFSSVVSKEVSKEKRRTDEIGGGEGACRRRTLLRHRSEWTYSLNI